MKQTPSMAPQHPLEGTQAHCLPHILMHVSWMIHSHIAMDTPFTRGYKTTQRGTAMDTYREAPVIKTHFATQSNSDTRSNAQSLQVTDTHPPPRHNVTASQGPKQFSGHTHPIQ